VLQLGLESFAADVHPIDVDAVRCLLCEDGVGVVGLVYRRRVELSASLILRRRPKLL